MSSTVFRDVIRIIGGFHIGNVYKAPSMNLNPKYDPHPSVIFRDFNNHHPDWGYEKADTDGENLNKWASANDLCLLHDSIQKITFNSAR
jgi:hypothetical protein